MHWDRYHIGKDPDKVSRPASNKKEGKDSKGYKDRSYDQPDKVAFVWFLWGIDQRRINVQDK
jgi:hypothetical protein